MGKRQLPPVPSFSVNGVEICPPTKRALKRDGLVDDMADDSSESSTESVEEAPTLHLAAAAGEESSGPPPGPSEEVLCPKLPREVPRAAGNYSVEAELGRGGFARVFRARHRDKEVAVKFVDLRPLRLLPNADKLRLNLEREMRIMAKLSANNFTVGCFLSGFVEDWCYFVLELMTLGSLHDALASRGCFHDTEASFVVSQLLDCLDFLHARSIVHRDIKPSNVLVCDKDVDERGSISYDVRVTDFGLSRQLDGGLLTLGMGTLSFMAPKIFRHRSYNSKVDFWSLGALLYVLLAGHYLRSKRGSQHQEQYDRAVSNLHNGSREARTALRGLLRVDPVQRWSQAEMRAHVSVNEWLEGDIDAD